MGNFHEVFLVILSLFANLKLMSLFIYEFLVYRLEIFRNCKEVKHMIMIIAVVYIFFVFYVIFDHQLKTTFRKSSALSPSEKIHSLLFTQSSPKNSEIASPPFFAKIEKFFAPPPPPAERVGGHCMTCIFNGLSTNFNYNIKQM